MDLGSGGAPSCACGSNLGGAGGGAINITAAYAEINGTIAVDGAAGATASCAAGFVGSGGSGGSILLQVQRLGYSTGLLRANGGAGTQNSNAVALHGAGGSGGRIAVLAGAHAFASDGWSDWLLRADAAGGLSYGSTTVAGAPGTVYIDAGTRNRTLVVDNGDALRPAAYRWAALPVDATTMYSLREIRVARGGHLRLTTPTAGAATLSVGVGRVTGDASGLVSLANRTTLALGANASTFASEVFTTDSAAAVTRLAPGVTWSVSWSRSFSLEGVGSLPAGITTDAGSVLLCPPVVVVNGSTVDISGAVGFPTTSVSINNGGRLMMRAGSAVLGVPGPADGTGVVSLAGISITSGSTLSIDTPYTFNVTNVTASGAAAVSLGAAAPGPVNLVTSVFASSAGSFSTAIAICSGCTMNASWIDISGGSLAVGANASIATNAFSIAGASWTSSAGMKLVATAGVHATSGAALAGDISVRSLAVAATGDIGGTTVIAAAGTITMSGTPFIWDITGVHTFSAANIVIAAGVTLDGTGGGTSWTASGTGIGLGTSVACVNGTTTVPWGGAHAGCGSGAVNCSVAVDGATPVAGAYGNTFAPTALGSAGTPHCTCGATAPGGAAVVVNATAQLSLNGSITVNGGSPASSACASYLPGAGSGGSIWINTGRLLYSTGLLSANGGAGPRNTMNWLHGEGCCAFAACIALLRHKSPPLIRCARDAYSVALQDPEALVVALPSWPAITRLPVTAGMTGHRCGCKPPAAPRSATPALQPHLARSTSTQAHGTRRCGWTMVSSAAPVACLQCCCHRWPRSRCGSCGSPMAHT